FPVSPDRGPPVTETLLVGVAILRDDRGNAFGMTNGQSKARRRAVVENVKREAIESDDLGKALDHASNVIECVTEFFARRHVGLAETGKVGRDEVEFVGKQRNEIAEHVSGARKAVQEKQLRRAGSLRLAIEHFDAVDFDSAVSDWSHQTLLCSQSPGIRPRRICRLRATTR